MSLSIRWTIPGRNSPLIPERSLTWYKSALTKVEGDFSYQDIVSVYHQESGQLLGKGKVRLGQSAVRDMLQSKKARGILIHRDDWISVTPEIDLLFTEF